VNRERERRERERISLTGVDTKEKAGKEGRSKRVCGESEKCDQYLLLLLLLLLLHSLLLPLSI
jgi:hypothetical protein